MTKPSCQELRSALLDLLDSIQHPDEIQFCTGLPDKRCKEILYLKEVLL